VEDLIPSHPAASRRTLVLAAALALVTGLRLEASDPARFRYQPDPDAVPQTEARSFTPCVGGMAGPYPCDKVDLMAFLPVAQIGPPGSDAVSDIWGWTDSVTGHEYALVGRTNGTAFVDITDPANPVYVGDLPSATGTSSWRELKTYMDHAYIVSDQNGPHGMQIFDLTQLRSVVNPPVTFTETAHYAGFGRCHDMVLNEATGYGYCVGSDTCSGGAHMMNLANPEAPVFVGCDAADGYTHDAQCVVYHGPDAQWFGHEVCFDSNTDTLTIMDVSNKSAPLQISRTTYSGVGYTHQGWLTEDHVYFLLDDELDEMDFGHNTYTYIWNLADLDAPVLMGHYTGATPAIDHNQFIKGTYSYQADYRAGLRILDISQIASATLTQYGYFDTYPSSDAASFAGAWGNYPFFASGTVIVSSIGEGLFVLKPWLVPDFTLGLANATLDACSPGSAGTTVTVGSQGGYAGTVAMSAVGLPAAVTSSFVPNPVTAPGGSAMALSVASGATPGSFPFDVHGEDGALVHDLPATLRIADALPAAPVQAAPPDGAVGQPPRPTFSWSAASQATGYVVEVASDPGFVTIVHQSPTVAGTTYVPAVDLPPNQVLFWRVRGSNGCGNGADSAVWSFTTGPAVVPAISALDVSAPEDPPTAPDHPSQISFPVTLSAYTSQTVTVDYTVAAGTATAGLDFEPSSGTLSFPPNITSQPVSVNLIDDLLDEDDETLILTLSAPANATIADGVAIGTILDDDPPPVLTVAGASALEGNVGFRTLAFAPTLSLPSGKSISLDYSTGGGTATPGTDYLPAAGALSFAPGATAQPIDVTLVSDLLSEGDETFQLSLSNGANVILPLAPVVGTIRDDDPVAAASGRELVHGSVVQADLAAEPGPLGDQDLYRIAVPPGTSVEVVADGLTGDVMPLVLQRLASDGTTVIDSAAGLSLRWENASGAAQDQEQVRVASGGCTADCDATDRYRIRALDTTASASRFNNSATQATVLLLQNASSEEVTGHVWFRDGAGAAIGAQAFSLAPRASLALDTRTVPGVAGASGSLTISHTGTYGAIAGKAVAVEPATGFTFDTPLVPRPR
jgi:choice-of-anchor B domain-containing protein